MESSKLKMPRFKMIVTFRGLMALVNVWTDYS